MCVMLCHKYSDTLLNKKGWLNPMGYEFHLRYISIDVIICFYNGIRITSIKTLKNKQNKSVPILKMDFIAFR